MAAQTAVSSKFQHIMHAGHFTACLLFVLVARCPVRYFSSLAVFGVCFCKGQSSCLCRRVWVAGGSFDSLCCRRCGIDEREAGPAVFRCENICDQAMISCSESRKRCPRCSVNQSGAVDCNAATLIYSESFSSSITAFLVSPAC